MFSWKYVNPKNWALLIHRSLLREQLALLIWQCLPLEQQQQDNAQLLRTIAELVGAVQLAAGPIIQSQTDAGELVSVCVENERYETIVQVSHALHSAHQRWQLSSVSVFDEAQAHERLRQIWGREASKISVPTRLISQLNAVRSLRSEFLKVRMRTGGFSLDKVGGLLPIVSGLFLFSGYIYNRLLLNPFGIDVSRFFGLSDYFSASLVGIEPMILALGVTFVGSYFYASNTRLAHLNRLIGARRYLDVLTLTAFIGAFILVWVNWQEPLEKRLIFWYILVIMLVTTLPNYYSMRFKQPVKAYFIMSYTPLFFSVLAFLATNQHIRLDDPERFHLDYLVTQGGVSTEYQMLAGNSLYVFLRDKDKRVTILPLEAIEQIRLLPKKENAPSANDTPVSPVEPVDAKPKPVTPGKEQ